jgi:hypothetical protein
VPEYRLDLASSHNDLGILLAETGRRGEAEAAYRAALALHQPLAAAFPAVPQYHQLLAHTHNNLGILLKDMDRAKEAEAAYRDALALYQPLAADFPAAPQYRRDLARSNLNLGTLLEDTGRLKEAEAAFADALAIRKHLAADFLDRPEFREDLAGSHYNLGILLQTPRPIVVVAGVTAGLVILVGVLAGPAPKCPGCSRTAARSSSEACAGRLGPHPGLSLPGAAFQGWAGQAAQPGCSSGRSMKVACSGMRGAGTPRRARSSGRNAATASAAAA